MKQEIRFCTADDGVRIAYALAGAGTPVVKAANWLNHLEFDWESPIWRHTLEPIARRHLLVRYDERGNGLSDWDVPELTFDAFVQDLETVVDEAQLERFALFGISQGCAVSIAYAIRHPERVSRLVLYGGYARGWRARGNPDEIEKIQAIHVLMGKGWGKDNPAFRQIFTSLFVPGGTHEQVTWFNDLQRMTTSPENAIRLSLAMSTIDVLDLLPRVQVPTLVLHSRGDAVVPFEAGRTLATRIPRARFVQLEAQNHLILGQEPAWEKFIEEILTFLESPNPALTDEERAAAKSHQLHTPSSGSRMAWSEADRIFDKALDLPVSERPAWLERACGSDRELQERVKRLLALSEAPPGELRTGAAMTGSLGDEVATALRGEIHLSSGDQLGPYKIVGDLGHGGMGTVYRARHEGLDREVAVKALSRVFTADASSLRRFQREAKLLASLNHPNIATVHDLLVIDERTYLVMELVEGPTLAEHLAKGRLALDEVVRIASQLVDALEEAHRADIVHRDLKPPNIKLTAKGRVKVLDFGLAKSIASVSKSGTGSNDLMTRTGLVLGTPGYMSPEQARGEDVDARADNWAFGCLLYEMLTGERAFTGQTIPEVIASVLRDDVDWTRVPRSTPPELVKLMKRCLERNRDARIQHIGEARPLLSLHEAPLESEGADSSSLFWIMLGLIAIGILAYVLVS